MYNLKITFPAFVAKSAIGFLNAFLSFGKKVVHAPGYSRLHVFDIRHVYLIVIVEGCPVIFICIKLLR